jgi:hypothetical protein
MEEIKAHKALKFKELKDKRGTPEYEAYFLSYKPGSTTDRQEKRGKTRRPKKHRRQKTKKVPVFDPYNSRKGYKQ